ncbi:P-loop containing nucleoside triphosphate hydrolase protein [Aspergillus fijiensis CBS 313.89]|uniref:P-loop containing nucleoside triphosphate hydrolase protein n=1 Tax=Aspergillus fijiensis CBS 313.89 TaxID=1448319 RepID=A0A8G1W0K6_9EURO|nr:P-loop containing nucleoside triphosphate hydrolase protein [Aspergillus fijiensis CBS 313.89]RAK80010.1 P-loop containing nucleoside triphosphate hydrolase protein [Aspergillus fijiensis CBS 313.89]
MLLVGNPGTGKTPTAEAIADQVRKPLYALSAGELGQQAEGVERRLSTVLELTERWDAVLLFDECDVFLQEWSGNQMQHNEVVAVFLRCLEYYRGIMIMTSNRADAIDGAFQSRIHLTLHYPDLDGAAREQIWRRCLTRSKCQHALTDEEVRRLALVTINGRQTKNTVRVAALLASHI